MMRKRKDVGAAELSNHLGSKFAFIDYLNVMIGILEHLILDVPNSRLLQKLLECLEKVKHAKEIAKNFEEDFFMFIQNEYDEIKRKSQRKLGFWCFNPSYAFHNFLKEKP
jgi:hypothetical protein